MSRTLPQYQSPPIPRERLREVMHQARNRATVAMLSNQERTARLWMQIVASCETKLAGRQLLDGAAEAGVERPALAHEDPGEIHHPVAPHFASVHVSLRGLLH